MSATITERDRERFRKVVLVMKSATLEGEREAARVAAERLAYQWGMTMDEAIVEAHPEVYGDKVSEKEAKAHRQSAHEAWQSATMRMMREKEAAEKYQFEMARQAARERGLNDAQNSTAKVKAERVPRSFYKNYQATETDQFRLISALLKDGLPLARVAELADVSTNEVARVYLLTR